MQYIIRTDEKFRGHVQSVVNDDGTVGYTGGLMLKEYEAKTGLPLRIIGESELNDLISNHLESLVTKPALISKGRFWEMLEILPPCRWHSTGGFEVFHVSERLTHSLVSWFAHRGNEYWEFTDHDHLSDTDLSAKLQVTS